MSAISDYQAAVAEIKTAFDGAERIKNIIARTSAALAVWKRAMISDVSGGFPPEVALDPNNPSISGREYPSIEQIAAALQRYHAAKAELQKKYDAIPESERSVVQPPQIYF